MLKTLSLALPVLIPSWNFFQTVEPSPRVQWRLVPSNDEPDDAWREFRPKPATITPFEMLCRLFWSPQRNEELFVVSCAERIWENPTAHSITEISRRVLADIAQMPLETSGKQMVFRLVFVSRASSGLSHEVIFQSDPVPASAASPR